MLTNSYMLTALAIILLFGSLHYIIVHNQHLHQKNLQLPMHHIKAVLSELIYIDEQHSDAIEVIFTTKDDQHLKYFIDRHNIKHPIIDQKGILTLQGTEFRSFS